MARSLGPEDFEKGKILKQALAVILNRANSDRVPGAVAVIALAQLMREIIDAHPPSKQKAMKNAIARFLDHQAEEFPDHPSLLNLQ